MKQQDRDRISSQSAHKRTQQHEVRQKIRKAEDKKAAAKSIQQKQRRKELAVYDLTKMEILAPADSHHLDSYKNKALKVIDYSSRREEDKADRYVLILSDDTKLILDLTGDYGQELLDILRIYSPRKVFRN